jgi:hypothetical protein
MWIRSNRSGLTGNQDGYKNSLKLSGLPISIGAWFGNRDASLVSLYCRAVMRRMSQDPSFAASVITLKKSLETV